jgi:FtsH-binding integral membrane protein
VRAAAARAACPAISALQRVAGEDDVIAGKKTIMGALALYLDFLNLSLMLLQLFGDGCR